MLDSCLELGNYSVSFLLESRTSFGIKDLLSFARIKDLLGFAKIKGVPNLVGIKDLLNFVGIKDLQALLSWSQGFSKLC